MADYLKKVQKETENLGERLRGIREANGHKQFSLIGRAIERGESVLDNGHQITVQDLIRYCQEIGAAIGPYNNLAE